MKIIRMHDEPDTFVTSHAYYKHYKEECEKHGFPVVCDIMVPAGYSYLMSRKAMEDQYKEMLKGEEIEEV